MSRTMLNEQSLPQKFWCNAVDTSTYILNRILIRAILGKTSYELLKGRKPTLDYFRVYSQNSKALHQLNKHNGKRQRNHSNLHSRDPPPSKTSLLVDDELNEEEAIKVTEKKNLENDIEDETLEIDEIVKSKNVKEALADERWIIAMQEELNQFIANDFWELVPQPKNMTIIGTNGVRNK
ncbi:retrovirus-related pol polyprotein from transposon TNT 1-94 [Tanacetum coccineum]